MIYPSRRIWWGKMLTRIVLVILGLAIIAVATVTSFDQGLNHCFYWVIGSGIIAFACRYRNREYRRVHY